MSARLEEQARSEGRALLARFAGRTPILALASADMGLLPQPWEPGPSRDRLAALLRWARSEPLTVAHMRHRAGPGRAAFCADALRPRIDELVCEYAEPSFYACEAFGRFLAAVAAPVLLVVGMGPVGCLAHTIREGARRGHIVIGIAGSWLAVPPRAGRNRDEAAPADATGGGAGISALKGTWNVEL